MIWLLKLILTVSFVTFCLDRIRSEELFTPEQYILHRNEGYINRVKALVMLNVFVLTLEMICKILFYE